MTIFEKASIRASILGSIAQSTSWDVDHQKERLERYKALNNEADSHDYDAEIEDAEFRISIYESVTKTLEKML